MRRLSLQPEPALSVALCTILSGFLFFSSTTTMAARTVKPEQADQATPAVSNTFRPGAFPNAGPEDIVLISTDRVLFYVHSARLLAHSSNSFAGLVVPPAPPTTRVASATPDRTAVLSIVLHTLYGLPSIHLNPGTADLLDAVDALARYGAPIQQIVVPGTPLWHTLEPHIVRSPLDVYACAGAHNLRDLAVHASVYLLGTKAVDIPDSTAVRMGPLFLKRLLDLRMGRVERLKRLIYPGPEAHAPLPECGPAQQAVLERAWRFAASYFVWDARPGT